MHRKHLKFEPTGPDKHTDQPLANAFNALAHPRRVRLFRLLVENPELGGSVGALQRLTGFRKAALLHHLRMMERAGLVLRRRTANATVQVLKPAALTAAMDTVQHLANANDHARRTAA